MPALLSSLLAGAAPCLLLAVRCCHCCACSKDGAFARFKSFVNLNISESSAEL